MSVNLADSLADAEAVPEANAEADADSLADADAVGDAEGEAEAQYARGFPYDPYGNGGQVLDGSNGYNNMYNPETDGCPNVNMMDECCGMNTEGCCLGGQKCYTYYERQCENVNEPVCDMKGKKFCETITLNDCRVVREKGTLVSSFGLKHILSVYI